MCDYRTSGAANRGRKKDREQKEIIKQREQKRRNLEAAREIQRLMEMFVL